MEQCKEVRNDIVDRIGHEHLVAVELDLVARDLDIVLDLREIEDTGKVERIIHVKMDMEERLLRHRIESPVELIVILILEIGRLVCPERLHLVDDIIFLCINIFAILPFLFLSEHYRHRHELAVLVQETLDTLLLGEFLLIVCDVESDDSTSVSLVALLHVILRRTVA